MDVTSSPQAESGKKERDVRLDFFRGLAMFIIFMAHVPGNAWGRYIPARFGPSDAAEIVSATSAVHDSRS